MINTGLKRTAAIHDISCAGRCSLTVALPIISAAGIETSIIPTAVLSTHTGGFEDYTYRDLTDDMLPIAEHWAKTGIHFDAVYSGFLGSIRQVEIVLKMIDLLKSEDTLVIVDPVAADNGKLYTGFDMSFPAEMKKLCAGADIIVPNITEAVFLLGEEYREGPYTVEYINSLLVRLADIGPSKIILTGVSFDEKNIGAACYDSDTGKSDFIFRERIEGFYPGTGDVFASVLTASLLSDLSVSESVETAIDFTVSGIKRTRDAGTDPRFGILFESDLSGLADKIKNNRNR